jgi:hypothetical protein
MLARSSTGGYLLEFMGELKRWPVFITAYKTSTRICGYTGGKCVAIAKLFERQSGRSGFYVAVSDVALKIDLDGEEAPFYE